MKLLIFFILLSINAHALPNGSQLWYTGFNAAVSAQGYSGAASKGSAFYSFINPASSALNDNIRIIGSGNVFTGGSLTENEDLWGHLPNRTDEVQSRSGIRN